MSSEDHRRCKFLQMLWTPSGRGRAHLLSVESAEELSELKRAALDEQHFELAAAVVQEIKRRAAEAPT